MADAGLPLAAGRLIARARSIPPGGNGVCKLLPGNSVDGSRVLITGGAGMVGSHIADRLLSLGAERITILDNLARGRRENVRSAMSHSDRIAFVEGDIRDRKLVSSVTQGMDYVVHQAATRITHCAEFPREGLEILVDGSFNIIEAAADAGVRKIVAASSASVYGEPAYLPMDENHPFLNDTMYGAGKIAMEALLKVFARRSSLDYCVFRPFNVYGERMDTSGAYTEVMIRWMKSIHRGQPIQIYGDGTQAMDFVHVEDVARAQVAGLTLDAREETMNLGSGQPTDMIELADLLMQVIGARVPVEYVPDERGLVARRKADIRKARNLLDFEPKIGLREGLRRLYGWWLEDGGDADGTGGS